MNLTAVVFVLVFATSCAKKEASDSQATPTAEGAAEIIKKMEADHALAPWCGTVIIPLRCQLVDLGGDAKPAIEDAMSDSPIRDLLEGVLEEIEANKQESIRSASSDKSMQADAASRRR